MNDPVLDRAMFRNQAPVSSYGTGITSNVASPDEAARALQMAFQPTGYAGGGQVINGVKHFQQGGENVSGGRSFLGGMFRLPDPDTVLTPSRYKPVMQAMEERAQARAADAAAAAYDQDIRDQNVHDQGPEEVPKSQFGRAVAAAKVTPEERAAQNLAVVSVGQRLRGIGGPDETKYPGGALDPFRDLTDEQIAERAATRAQTRKEIADAAIARSNAGIPSIPTGEPIKLDAPDYARPGYDPTSKAAVDKYLSKGIPSVAPPAAKPVVTEAAAAAAPTVPPPADKAGAGAGAKNPDEESGLGKRLSLRIDELKQEREANKAQRRENQLLALMQAGFQAAAGKSSSALTNIASGGSAGIATLADLEKTRRAEDTALRGEALQLELAKEKMIESGAERRSQREMLTSQRQQSLLQNVTVNARQEISGINSTIANEEAKLLNPAVTEDQKAPIKAEIARLKNQRDVAAQQLYDVYAQMGLKRPMTPEQQQPAAGFSYIGPKK
jgi:hypothetical protein